MSRPAPLLLLCRELGLGGSERQLAEAARSLDRSRFAPHAGCFRPEGMRGDELRRGGVPVVSFPVRSFRAPSTLAAFREIGRYVEHHSIRLVHAFDAPMNLFAVPAARFFRVPAVLSSQRAHRHLTPGLTRHLLRLTDAMADVVVVNSEDVRDHLIHDERVPAAKIRLCHNGVDTSVFFPAPGAPTVAATTIGVVSALRAEKGLHTLLEAFHLLRSAHPEARLLIVGDGPLRQDLAMHSRQLGLGDGCVFRPATEDVASVLRSIHIFVLPSLFESFSNALMEAMACGCAAVASRVGGNAELVRDRRRGLLFRAGDSAELSERLRELTEQPELRRALAAEGSRYVRDHFSLASAAERMGQIYSELLERHA
jgi:glycosyltransferase involved in cell wall biosynthesis